MTNQTLSCDDEALRLVLEGDENSEAYLRATRHIESCETCQHRIMELSANADHWKSQQEMLQPIDGDDAEAGYLSRFGTIDFEHPRRWIADESTIVNMLAAPSHPEMLGRLGRYEIEKVIGSGGMGVVLKGFDTDLNRPVAIKLLAPHLASVGAARYRFAREARAAAAVVHEHVVPIHNVESENKTPFLVMQFVSGESLQARLDREGPLSVVEILRISMQAASGLAAAHAQGLVHRDVKPANILLENGVERAYLSDFGLARTADDVSATCTGVIAGTPHYMSPEQVTGAKVDARSDLFGLGSSMYAMCVGRPPFRGDNSYAVLRAITDKVPQPIREINPDIPQWLCTIISRLMEKSPDARYASAQDVAALLEQCLAHVQEPTVKVLPAEALRSHRGSNGMGKWLLALAGFGVIGLFGLGLVQTNPPDIAGDWMGQEEWGQVTIKKGDQGAWHGTFTDTTADGPGSFTVKWSRISRRFNGMWTEGGDRAFGDLSIRMDYGEIRGAYSIDKRFVSDPEASHMADLHWIRAEKGSPGDSKVKSQGEPTKSANKPWVPESKIPEQFTPLAELERRAALVGKPVTAGLHFVISKDRKYYAKAHLVTYAPPQILLVDAESGKVVAKQVVPTPVGPLQFTDEGVGTWEADGTVKLRLPFKVIEQVTYEKMVREVTAERMAAEKLANENPHAALAQLSKLRERVDQSNLDSGDKRRLLTIIDRSSNELQAYIKRYKHELLAEVEENAPAAAVNRLTLEDAKKRIGGMENLEKYGHFLISEDGKLFAYANGAYPFGPVDMNLHDSATGQRIGSFYSEGIVGPFQFTDEGLATREPDGKVVLRIPFKSDDSSSEPDEGEQNSNDRNKPIPLKSINRYIRGVEGLEKYGHFLISEDKKLYAYANGTYPYGPVEVCLRDAVTGKLLGSLWVKEMVGPFQFTPEGLATREAEGKVILRVPLKADGASPEPTDSGTSEKEGGAQWDAMIAKLREVGLDIVIVFDSTGSMDGEIGQLKRDIEKTGSALWRLIPKARIGLTTYRDKGEDYLAYGLPLTNDIGEIQKFLDGVRADGGGDLPEAVDAGMEWTLSNNAFQPDARKVMLIVGDAPPHRENEGTCVRMANLFWKSQGGEVSTISCRSPNTMAEFDHIARVSGGEAFATTDVKQIMTQLMVAAFGSRHREQVLKAFELTDPR